MKFLWLKSAFSEGDGRGSITRILLVMVVSTTCALVSFVTVKHASIPDLTGMTAFCSAICALLYGINRGAEYLTTSKLAEKGMLKDDAEANAIAAATFSQSAEESAAREIR